MLNMAILALKCITLVAISGKYYGATLAKHRFAVLEGKSLWSCFLFYSGISNNRACFKY